MRPDEIVCALQNMGYEEINNGPGSFVMALPGKDTVIHLTGFTCQAEAFADICRAHKDNPHFPTIYDSYRTEGHEPVLLMVMERLQTLDDIPEKQRPVFGGFARALATVMQGHKSHDAVHRTMLEDKNVADAILAIIEKIENFKQTATGTFIHHKDNFNEAASGSIEDWYPDNILFRPGEDNNWELVFTSPFSEITIDNKEKREAFRQELQTQRHRIESLLPPKDENPATVQQDPRFNP